MKINKLHIDGFGIFANKEISSLAPNLNVFCGPNEAGKSTLLAFIRRVLYGYPDGRSKQNMYPPQNGGNHGGWLNIENEETSKFRLERYSGSSINFTDSSGSQLGEYDLNKILGHSPETVFRNVYAFSLSELQDFDTLDNDEIRNKLYSAGAGMGDISLSDVQKDIDKQAGDLFKERGSTQIITKIFSETCTIDQELKDIQKGQAEFERQHNEFKRVSSEIEEFSEEERDLNKELRHKTGLKEARASWAKTTECEEDLEELPGIEEFPINGLVNLEKIEEKIEELEEEASEKETELRVAVLARDSLSIDSALIELKNEVKKLHKATEKYKSAVTDHPNICDKRDSVHSDLIGELKEIGPDWDVEKLQSFDTSIPTRKTVEKHQNEYIDLEKKQATHEGELANLNNNYKTARKEIDQFDKENDKVKGIEPIESIDNKLKAIGNVRVSLREMKEKEAEIRGIDERLEIIQGISYGGPQSAVNIPSWPPYALFAVGVLVMILSIIYDVLLIGIINLIILLVLGLVLLSLGKAQSSSQPTPPTDDRNTKKKIATSEARKDAIRKEINYLMGSVKPNLGLLKLNKLPGERELEELALQIQAKQGLSIRLEESKKRRSELVTKLKAINGQIDEVKNVIKRLKEEEIAVSNKWKAWLKSKDLDSELSHDAAIEVFQIIRNCRDKLKNINEYDKRLGELSPFIANFEERVIAVLEATGQETTDLDYLFEAEKLSNDVEHALEDEESLKEQNLIINKIKIGLEKTTEKLEKQRKNLSGLLESVEVSTPDEFRQKADNWEKRSDLLDILEVQEKELKKILGDNYQDKITELESLDIDELEQSIDAINTRLEEIEENLDNLKETRGGVLQVIKDLQQEKKSSVLRLEKEGNLKLLQNNSEDWAMLTIAKSMLNKAIRKYEQERQPGVIKEAEKYLATMTGGRYTQIVSPMDEEKIYVINSMGKRLDIGELSRGTAEQLYLSLRFGFIQEFNKRAVPLPIIIDDIFVNFDPERFSYTSTIIQEIASSNQVFYFTCHPETAEYLVKNVGEAKMIDLKSNSEGN